MPEGRAKSKASGDAPKRGRGPPKGSGGRPKGSGDYTEEVGRTIAFEVLKGRPLTVISEEMGISYWTICGWRDSYPDFCAMLQRARDDAVEHMFWQARQVAENTEEGETTEEGDGPKGPFNKVRRGDMVEHRKLKVNTYLTMAARHNPKRFGGRGLVEDDQGSGTEVVVRGGLPSE